MSKYPSTDTKAIESYINNGGAVADAQKSLAVGNKIASAGVSAGVGVAKATVGGSAALATKVASINAIAGTSLGVPVVGWIVAGVLTAASGGIMISAKRRARFLNKDRKIFEKYIKKFERKSEEWRMKEARKQISQIQYLLTKKQTNRVLKKKAKAELKLEALFFIYREKNYSSYQQKAIDERAIDLLEEKHTNLVKYAPLYIGVAGLGIFFIYKALKR